MANNMDIHKYTSHKLKWNFQFIQDDHKPNESIKWTIKVSIKAKDQNLPKHELGIQINQREINNLNHELKSNPH